MGAAACPIWQGAELTRDKWTGAARPGRLTAHVERILEFRPWYASSKLRSSSSSSRKPDMEAETRAGLEFRVSGRTLSGVVLRYGDVAPQHRERFMPGRAGARSRRSDERAARQGPGSAQSGRVRADRLRAGSSRCAPSSRKEAQQSSSCVRGALAADSVLEFHALAERSENGIRVIERGDDRGRGPLSTQPAYPASKAEVRAAMTTVERARGWCGYENSRVFFETGPD